MLPTFHVISLVCNVVFNLYVGARVIIDAGAARRPLSPEIVYEARSSFPLLLPGHGDANAIFKVVTAYENLPRASRRNRIHKALCCG